MTRNASQTQHWAPLPLSSNEFGRHWYTLEDIEVDNLLYPLTSYQTSMCCPHLQYNFNVLHIPYVLSHFLSPICLNNWSFHLLIYTISCFKSHVASLSHTVYGMFCMMYGIYCIWCIAYWIYVWCIMYSVWFIMYGVSMYDILDVSRVVCNEMSTSKWSSQNNLTLKLTYQKPSKCLQKHFKNISKNVSAF